MPVSLSGIVDNARVRMRDNQRLVNTGAVELHKKFAISIACVVFVLVGAPIALRFPLGGVGTRDRREHRDLRHLLHRPHRR